MKEYFKFFIVFFFLLFSFTTEVVHARVVLSDWKMRYISDEAGVSYNEDWMAAGDAKISEKYIGYIEYSADLNIEENNDAKNLGLYLGDISDSDKIYVNGVMVGSTGEFPPNFQGYIDYTREYLIPSGLLKQNLKNKISIIVYVEYPSKKGINISTIKIGKHSDLQHMKYYHDAVWYLSKLLMPLICAVLATIIFLSLRIMPNKKHALTFIGIAISFCLFGLSRSRITFHLFDIIVAYKILIFSGVAGVSLLFYHSTEGLRFRWRGSRLITFAPLLYFFSSVFLQDSVNGIFSRYKPWFYVGTSMLVVSFTLSCYYRRVLGKVFTIGLGILTALGVYDTAISVSKFRAPYLFDVGINFLIIFLIYKHIIEIKNSYENITKEKVKFKAQVDISSQVAHDIRSPLAALEVAVAMLKEGVSEEMRILMRSALRRITDIANDLGGRKVESEADGKGGASDREVTLLSALIDSVVSEKRMEYQKRSDLEIVADVRNSYGLFAKIGIADLKRAISNLVNNSVQAFEEGYQGRVVVSLKEEDGEIKIIAADNGKGIPAGIIGKLGIEGNSFGKTDGKGLGLFQTRSSVEAWGGSFKVSSELAKGTDVILTLPKEEPPNWFVAEIKITEKTCVVIVDDDDSIHLVWEARFGQLQTQPQKIEHFRTAEATLQKFPEIKKHHENILFLCDYELLGQPENGLDLIEELAIRDAILVTSHYEEKELRRRCERLKVRLLPKGLAGFVPIKWRETRDFRDAEYVLVDDSRITRENWDLMARAYGKKVITFSSIDEFYANSHRFDRAIKIYIDSSLGNGIKGEEVAKEIFAKGFKRIFLCTGYSPKDFPPMPWIEAIVGKEPPFLREGKEGEKDQMKVAL